MARWLYSVREAWRIVLCRLRVHVYRLTGARGIDPKCLIGKRSRIERPWCLELGSRCVLQPDVWLNIGADTARLMMETEKSPTELREMVTSPGGTTMVGLGSLDEAGFGEIVGEAVMAATERARELGKKGG